MHGLVVEQGESASPCRGLLGVGVGLSVPPAQTLCPGTLGILVAWVPYLPPTLPGWSKIWSPCSSASPFWASVSFPLCGRQLRPRGEQGLVTWNRWSPWPGMAP